MHGASVKTGITGGSSDAIFMQTSFNSKCAVKVVQWIEAINSDLVASKLGHIFACPASWRCPLYLIPFSMPICLLTVIIQYSKADLGGEDQKWGSRIEKGKR